MRGYRQRNRELIKARNKAWAKTDKGRAGRAEQRRRHRQRYPEKALEYNRRERREKPEALRARDAVKYALKTGKLVRLPCEQEGCNRMDTQAHHDDYSKRLEVQWLCPVHHAQVEAGG